MHAEKWLVTFAVRSPSALCRPAGFKGFPRVSAGWHLPPFEPQLTAELQSFSWCQQRLPAGSGHAIQDNPCSARWHSGPQRGHSHCPLLHFQRLHWDPEGRCGGGDTGWAAGHRGSSSTFLPLNQSLFVFVCSSTLSFSQKNTARTHTALYTTHMLLCVLCRQRCWAQFHFHSTVALIINGACNLMQAA